MRVFPLAAIMGSLFAGHAHSAIINEDDRQDQSIEVSGGQFTPLIKVYQRYDDNVASSDIDDISSWATIYEPSVSYSKQFGEFGKNSYQLDYVLAHGAFHASDEDSYTDHDISGKVNYEINSRHRFVLQGGYIDSHDERGSRFSIGTGEGLTEPDTYQQFYTNLEYNYGIVEADLRLQFEYGLLDNNYDARFVVDASGNPIDRTRERDRQTDQMLAKLYYRVGSATDLTFEAVRLDVDYDFTRTPENELSSVEMQYLLGVKWEATALTTGYAKVGYKDKNFDLNSREDHSGFEWDAQVQWEPKTYSRFKLSTGRSTQETNGEGFFVPGRNGQGYFVINTTHELAWQHDWNNRFSTEALYRYSEDIYEGDVGEIRDDDNNGLVLKAYYDMSYWLSFTLEYVNNDRDSTRANLEYDRDLITLGVRVALK
ncbi:outer membrane beta-barrel protein [Thalassotalea euphylliae]|uniref:Outer membrane beta-barrel protein n=1 Tax=Thalassotalea euphylliae TaxID=1655234 RepID=A0A3E0UIV0_9GAMM|nr:outer membrane beta-barrel protein [Thalassotalea euphylliae]REL36553.1 hypothetical protein DXX92_15210 [Thalassotalea euphylliae]